MVKCVRAQARPAPAKNNKTKVKMTTMNLNLVTKYCDEWSRQDWQDAYDGYCKNNMFGQMTKREYYEFVKGRHKQLKLASEPLSDELKRQWTIGKRNARLWAKKHGCDMNGRSILLSQKEREEIETRELAERAEQIAIDALSKIEYTEREKGRNKRWRKN